MAKLLASDGASFDNFGSSIALGNGLAVVGAYGRDDNGPGSGAVYLFDAAGPCGPATGLRVAAVNGSTELRLNWADTSDATGYSVYEDTQPDGGFTTVTGTAASGVTGLTVPLFVGDRFYRVQPQSVDCP